jgi:phage shock protein A
MKNALIKWLGLNGLASTLTALRKENEGLKKSLADLEVVVADLETKVNDIEQPDMSDYVSEDEINDRIESYCNDNDIVSASYVDDEIESKVSEKVEEAIDDYGIEEKVRDLFNDASPSPMTEDDIKKEVSEAVKVTLEKMVKALADQR